MGYYMAGDYYMAGGFFSKLKKLGKAVVKVAYANPITKAVSQAAPMVGKAVGGPWGAIISAAGAANLATLKALEPKRAPAGMPAPGTEQVAPAITQATYNTAPLVHAWEGAGTPLPRSIAAPAFLTGRRMRRPRRRRRY